jgi:hypothetical protein
MDNASNNEDVFETETAPNDFFDTEHEQTLCRPSEANFTILCDKYSWHIDKETLCKRSEYFDLACNGPYLEATQSHMTLHDDDPDAVHDMLTYLMYDSYGPAFVDSAVDTHIAACDIADKYMLPGLQSYAVASFKECMMEMWESGTPFDPASDFAEVVERVYEDPRGLWEDPLKKALRIVTTVRLVQMLPGSRSEHEPRVDWSAQWGELGGSSTRPDAPRFMSDFWGSDSKLCGWWFKTGFPGLRFEIGRGEHGQAEGRVSCWVNEL